MEPLQFPMVGSHPRLSALNLGIQLQSEDALHHPEMYHFAIYRLSEEFGQSFVVSEAQVDKLLNFPFVNQDDHVGLNTFSNELHGAVFALIHTGNNVELGSSETLKLLLQKLPPDLCNKWGAKVVDMLPRVPNVVEFDARPRRLNKSQEFASQAVKPEQHYFVKPVSSIVQLSMKKELPHPTSALHNLTRSTSLIIQQKMSSRMVETLNFQRICGLRK